MSIYHLFQYFFIFESPKLRFGLKIIVYKGAAQNQNQGSFIDHFWCFEPKKTDRYTSLALIKTIRLHLSFLSGNSVNLFCLRFTLQIASSGTV